MSPRSKPQYPFFIYGTLLPGQPNDHLWQNSIRSQQQATFPNGRLYDMGPYPMMIEETGYTVHGLLVAVAPHSYQQTVARLDALEGYDPARPRASAYRRVVRKVVAADGRSVPAWVYLGQRKYVAGCPPVTAASWPHHVAASLDQIAKWWHDIKSVAGRHHTDEEDEN